MKTFLFTAMLFAGTTLGFAKSNAPAQNFSNDNKEAVSLKSTTVKVNSLDDVKTSEKAVDVKNICHHTVFTTEVTYTYFDDGMGNLIVTKSTDLVMTTYWYGC
ncbi:hypothetical protein SAMN05421866_3581 [Chryseobacterium oranimense]|uniref:Uncharacterized protein n=1 Tax=Chryseobacterium oranimense TaxID=421058 RepID=A0A1M5VEZ9_9FLAO|nr:hypothetical protein [Chryseobacterium oranimense]CEJ70555.1 hypothetical protein BN1195_02882 [Chryseobacterium oranimense G311]SHH73745.1 hypothetical protein SAMN05421866_3581 [Chryseobacterium oranimense]